MSDSSNTRHGGHIDKFIGDCVMAVFGVPKAVEDAPGNALACALEIRDRLYRFNNERNLPIHLDMHIGINTVMGATVNLASRLEELSKRDRFWSTKFLEREKPGQARTPRKSTLPAAYVQSGTELGAKLEVENAKREIERLNQSGGLNGAGP